jgi:hypothetical protein
MMRLYSSYLDMLGLLLLVSSDILLLDFRLNLGRLIATVAILSVIH